MTLLQLDARQRAMLEEMGVRVFAPDADLLAARDAPASSAPADPARQAGKGADLRPAALEPAGGEPAPAFSAPRPAAGVAEAPLRQRTPGVGEMAWEALGQAVAECRACRLCEGRSNTVFGVGDLQADWMVIGEAPGENEDLQGEPFVGQAGKLLDNMLAALGVGRGKGVYIANVLKCRPPGNRNPLPEEIAQCEPFLRRQVELLRPKIILAMGRFAVQTLLQTTEPVGRLRGRVHRYNEVPVVVTYHPAYLLRNLPDKAKAWADLCLAQEVLRGGA
jgi:uracil-DNA glycosylase family 4